jgi:hypothetical protein
MNRRYVKHCPFMKNPGWNQKNLMRQKNEHWEGEPQVLGPSGMGLKTPDRDMLAYGAAKCKPLWKVNK